MIYREIQGQGQGHRKQVPEEKPTVLANVEISSSETWEMGHS